MQHAGSCGRGESDLFDGGEQGLWIVMCDSGACVPSCVAYFSRRVASFSIGSAVPNDGCKPANQTVEF